MLAMKSGKTETVKGIELHNQKCIREKLNYIYLGILEVEIIKQLGRRKNKKIVPQIIKKTP